MDDEGRKGIAATPGWVVTFADLMTLLMCFFVLLLSFSEMDRAKYKTVAGSMESAFGVQRDMNVKATPKGTSMVAREFSPGKPTPTDSKAMQQKTSDQNRPTLEFSDGESGAAAERERQGPAVGETAPPSAAPWEEPQPTAAPAVDAPAGTTPEFQFVRGILGKEIRQGLLDLELRDGQLLIRIDEQGSFGSGLADLNAAYIPVVERIGAVLEQLPGVVTVAGHTDNRPLRTHRFRSNWDLSSARAVSVVQELLASSAIEANRLVVQGYGDSRPLLPNASAENRAKNRRVEITLDMPGLSHAPTPLPAGQ